MSDTKTYSARATYIGHGRVFVQAESIEEAREKFAAGDFDDDQIIENDLDEIEWETTEDC